MLVEEVNLQVELMLAEQVNFWEVAQILVAGVNWKVVLLGLLVVAVNF